MVRYLVAVMIAAASAACAAHAQRPEPEEGRYQYQFDRVEDGYLRLDRKTGQVSLCGRRPVGWSCLVVADERAALEAEMARLQGENVALKKALVDRGLPLPGGAAAPPPVAQGGGDSNIKLPTDAEIDRMMAVVEKVWRRLVEMMLNLQKDIMKKT